MIVCCPHNRCPDRPRRFLRRFRNRPWHCDQCGRLWVTRGIVTMVGDWGGWSWQEVAGLHHDCKDGCTCD